MKLFAWFNLGRHHEDEAFESICNAFSAQREARVAAEKRQRESLERDLLYINGLLRHDGSE